MRARHFAAPAAGLFLMLGQSVPAAIADDMQTCNEPGVRENTHDRRAICLERIVLRLQVRRATPSPPSDRAYQTLR
jgi:hypothetical protein